jgi:hypothetical protein
VRREGKPNTHKKQYGERMTRRRDDKAKEILSERVCRLWLSVPRCSLYRHCCSNYLKQRHIHCKYRQHKERRRNLRPVPLHTAAKQSLLLLLLFVCIQFETRFCFFLRTRENPSKSVLNGRRRFSTTMPRRAQRRGISAGVVAGQHPFRALVRGKPRIRTDRHTREKKKTPKSASREELPCVTPH